MALKIAMAVAAIMAVQPAPVATSTLRLMYEDGSGGPVTVALTCDPAGGGHPRAAEACAALAVVGADPGRLSPGDTYCYLVFRPVTAQVTGVWRGRSVTWRHTYGNDCELARATGVLFEF
ncbi:SSI family serine proteinase inhibitor [Actinoplanes sp. NPDC051851]|uniref:SSI family serine proteinase inhibitor n=1 Tax=Actinoplanes sp. NPDC051851 TaxID=3154753 RepID=UPI00343A6F8E